MANYKTETVTTQRTIPVEFSFLGNTAGFKVRKTDPNYGDGLITTGKGGYIYVQVTANWTKISQTKYQLHVWYRVYEDGYRKSKSSESLEFDAYQTIDFSSHYPVNNTSKVTESWQFTLDSECAESACYADWFKGGDKKRWGWYPIDVKDYPTYNRERTWFPAAEIRIKMADSGNDLLDAGNIGVKGIAYLRITAVKTIKTKMEETTLSFNSGGSAGIGLADSVLNLNNEYDLKEVLGYGYDMCSEYAVKEYLKAPVLNLDRLNNDRHILKSTPMKANQFKLETSGYDEYTKEMSSSLKVEAKGSLFGVTFSNTTETTSSTKKTEKNVYKLVTAYWTHQNALYKIDETNPAMLRPYVTDNFKRDLARLCRFYGTTDWAEELEFFMEKYGTHVITGMVTGGRVDLNMSYKQTTTNVSEASSFSTVSSIGYSESGQLKKPEGAGGKASLDIKEIEKLLDADGFEDLRKEVKKLLEKAKGTGAGASKGDKSGSAPTVGNYADVSVAWNMKEVLERATNEEINNFALIMRGGNLMVNPFTDDNTSFDKWRNTLDQKYSVWCDYVPGRIIPLYKFAPDNNSMKILEKAWTTYCENHGITCAVLEHRILSGPQTITGDTTCVKSLGNDANVYTSNEWPTGWKLNMNLVNISSERRMALAVRYQVVEGHKAQNWMSEEQLKGQGVFNYNDTSCTNLVLERVIPLDIPNSAVDTTKVVDHLEVSGVKKGDQTGIWIDVTNDVKRAIDQILTSSDRARGRKPMVETSYPYKFKIRLEGKGDDQNYLGLDFQLYLPFIKFNN